MLDVQTLINVDVDQFYGIEIEEFPAQIAQVALWLTDHQMNMKISEEFGQYFARIPLKATPHIAHGNALQTDWQSVLPAERCSYVLGNPPFIGHQWRSPEQMADMDLVWGVDGKFGRLDFVTAWYVKATRYMAVTPSTFKGEGGDGGEMLQLSITPASTPTLALPLHGGGNIKCAFVSTNSITQGEQVGTLWSWMLAQGIKIHFAHRTFSWNNEARGRAAVHCVIIGFGLQDVADKTIYEYEDIKGEPHAIKVNNINPYLIDAPDFVLPSRTATPAGLPQLIKGSQPTDGGHLILTEFEKNELVANEPQAEKWLRQYIGGEELINGSVRYCLWLKDASPNELKAMPNVMQRVKAVADWRLTSATASVRDYSAMPTLFTQDRQPTGVFLALPEVSSERRQFIPIAFLSADIVPSNKIQVIDAANHYHFGILCSTMHNAWMRTVAGRLESRYSYAPAVYNNFPWPSLPSSPALLPAGEGSENRTAAEKSTNPSPTGRGIKGEGQKQAIETAAQAVLDARAAHPNASLADLYDPLTMPANLLKAHNALDKAVDAAYGYKGAQTDAARVAFLFEFYQKLTSLLPAEKAKKTRKKN